MNKLGVIGAVVIVIIGLAASMLFVVDQRQFGVVYQFGEAQKVIIDPGLNWKLPAPIQTVSYVDKRLLTLESSENEPLLTAEKQRVVVEWYLRWRISDPLEYIRNVGLDESAGALQLNRVMRDAVQEEINRRTVKELIAAQRETLMADVKNAVIKAVQRGNPWGIDIIDVRITRADYVASITESVYKRMQAERQRVANELRSTGAAEGEQIRAEADRQVEVTIAEAYRKAQTTRGEGESVANRTFAQAFGRDPDFAEFYRSLNAYRDSVGQPGDLLVIDPKSSDFFRSLLDSGAQRGK